MKNLTEISDPNKDFVKSRLGNMVDFSEVGDLSVRGISPMMKQAALAMMPDIFRSMVFMAVGETVYECEHCGEENRVITGNGDFRAAKYMMEQGLEWIPVIKTMSLNIGVDIQIPDQVLTATTDKEVLIEIFLEIAREFPEITPQDAYSLMTKAKDMV